MDSTNFKQTSTFLGVRKNQKEIRKTNRNRSYKNPLRSVSGPINYIKRSAPSFYTQRDALAPLCFYSPPPKGGRGASLSPVGGRASLWGYTLLLFAFGKKRRRGGEKEKRFSSSFFLCPLGKGEKIKKMKEREKAFSRSYAHPPYGGSARTAMMRIEGKNKAGISSPCPPLGGKSNKLIEAIESQPNKFFISCKQSRIENNTTFYGCFYLGPFETGQSVTIANALRRTLLSDLTGVAITSVEIEGAIHEYESLVGVREPVLDILLNLKEIILKKSFCKPRNRDKVAVSLSTKQEGKIPGLSLSPVGGKQKCFVVNPETTASLEGGSVNPEIGDKKKRKVISSQIGYLRTRGPGVVKASDLRLPPSLKCVDPEQYIATLSEDGYLNMKFYVHEGKNYVMKRVYKNVDLNERKKRLVTDPIPLLFSLREKKGRGKETPSFFLGKKEKENKGEALIKASLLTPFGGQGQGESLSPHPWENTVGDLWENTVGDLSEMPMPFTFGEGQERTKGGGQGVAPFPLGMRTPLKGQGGVSFPLRGKSKASLKKTVIGAQSNTIKKNKSVSGNLLYLDAVFMPVTKVNYIIEANEQCNDGWIPSPLCPTPFPSPPREEGEGKIRKKVIEKPASLIFKKKKKGKSGSSTAFKSFAFTGLLRSPFLPKGEEPYTLASPKKPKKNLTVRGGLLGGRAYTFSSFPPPFVLKGLMGEAQKSTASQNGGMGGKQRRFCKPKNSLFLPKVKKEEAYLKTAFKIPSEQQPNKNLKHNIMLEIWTNGSMHPRQALYDSFKKLLSLFSKLQKIKIVGSMLKSDKFYKKLIAQKLFISTPKPSILNGYSSLLFSREKREREAPLDLKRKGGFDSHEPLTPLAPLRGTPLGVRGEGEALSREKVAVVPSNASISKADIPASFTPPGLLRSPDKSFYGEAVDGLFPPKGKGSLKSYLLKEKNISKTLDLIDVGSLNISLRPYTCLKRANIHTVKDLLTYEKQQLLEINNFGARSLEEVEQSLNEIGLLFKS